MEDLLLVKIGGNIIDDEHSLSAFLNEFAAIPGHKILVHGGGKLATKLAETMGIQQQLVDGRRITDAETLKVVTMVYAGYINKNITVKLQARDCNAIGITGVDGNAILAHKRQHATIDYGFVGDIDEVNAAFLKSLLKRGHTLVVAPITHDKQGNLLNTNADTIATQLAIALNHIFDVKLVFCFEKNGVLQDPSNEESLISGISRNMYEDLKADNTISAGMIPKLDNAFDALSAGVTDISIGHALQLTKLLRRETGTSLFYDE
ncbi:MAG: N-acetylglutamate kinase [Ferruginibacter sp.]|nr:N-acetylglutamate kinase [Ferruginibacter sp.]